MSSIQEAAIHLLGEIEAPRGSVNTLAYFDTVGPVIRVLVDPSYWLQARNLPSTYEGYRVVVEKRSPTVALHS
jgi:hypothetical protein